MLPSNAAKPHGPSRTKHVELTLCSRPIVHLKDGPVCRVDGSLNSIGGLSCACRRRASRAPSVKAQCAPHQDWHARRLEPVNQLAGEQQAVQRLAPGVPVRRSTRFLPTEASSTLSRRGFWRARMKIWPSGRLWPKGCSSTCVFMSCETFESSKMASNKQMGSGSSVIHRGS